MTAITPSSPSHRSEPPCRGLRPEQEWTLVDQVQPLPKLKRSPIPIPDPREEVGRMLSRERTREIIALCLILSVGLVVRFWNIDAIPSVVNGDESGGIIHTLELVLGKHGSPFRLTHDGQISYVTYLEKAAMLRLLGLDNTLLATRGTTALLSLAALIPFYLLARKRMPRLVALSVTLLLSFGPWYLNFSRLPWIATDALFYGLWLFYFLEMMTTGGGWLPTLGAALSAGLVLYQYNGGKVFMIAAAAQLLYWLFKRSEAFHFREKLLQILIFGVVTSLIARPQIVVISRNFQTYATRADALYVLGSGTDYYGIDPENKLGVLAHQVSYTVRGLVLFDPRVSAEGIENRRYKPPQMGGINLFLVPFFLIGLISLLTRKDRSWSLKFSALYLSNLLFIQIPSSFVPNWARALSLLPTVYLSIGLGIEALWARIPGGFLKRHGETIVGGFVVISVVISITSFSTYWSWVQSPAFAQAQRPVVTVEEFPSYLSLMRDRIENDGRIFLLHDWNNPSWREKHLSPSE